MIRPLLVCALLPLAGVLPAQAGGLRWEPAAGGAAAIMPAPAQPGGVEGGTLFCRAGEWAFLLRAGRGATASAQAVIDVGEKRFVAPVKAGPGTLEVAVPAALVALLKDGAGVSVTLGEGKDAPSARFTLAGSRDAIEAAAPLCSPPAVPGFEAVALSAGGTALAEAAAATAAEARLFRAAAGREPAIAAALLEGDGGRALLFASLCGSERYYGKSGCKLMGFSRDGAAAAWKPVYETEGMHLFRDPRATPGGWPDLVTLPLAGAPERMRWTWRDGAYALADEPAVADDGTVIDGLRTGTTAQ
jgi:hypothetical protein